MIINQKRALAYTARIAQIKQIPNYDRVQHVRINGWWIVASKADQFKVGDLCIYFEIDSKVPQNDQRFSFLAQKHYKIKTQRMCKVYSQGLVMPLYKFPQITKLQENIDVTQLLNVTYSNEQDNKRKASDYQINLDKCKEKHKSFFKNKFVKKLMRYNWFRKLIKFIFSKDFKKKKSFPEFVSKTDEQRVQNQPFRCGDGKEYIITEKLDGTSCTYALQRLKKNKFQYYVCSRNVRQQTRDQKCYHDSNIYWQLNDKYNIEQILRDYLEIHPDVKYACIQGQGVGNVQGNPLQLKNNDLYVFNFIDSNKGRYPSDQGKIFIESVGMKWVPIIGKGYVPNDMQQFKQMADGNSTVNPSVMRQGFVYRSLDGSDSFKNVSRKYLEKHSN